MDTKTGFNVYSGHRAAYMELVTDYSELEDKYKELQKAYGELQGKYGETLSAYNQYQDMMSKRQAYLCMWLQGKCSDEEFAKYMDELSQIE
jgi:predicted nuclease with TOPRIM domain